MGFTPINRAQLHHNQQPTGPTGAATSVEDFPSTKSWPNKGEIERRTHRITAATKRKKPSAVSCRKRSKKGDSSQLDDIAKDLPRTKPKQNSVATLKLKDKQASSDGFVELDGFRDIADIAGINWKDPGFSNDKNKMRATTVSQFDDKIKASDRDERVTITPACPMVGLEPHANVAHYINPSFVMLAKDDFQMPRSAQHCATQDDGGLVEAAGNAAFPELPGNQHAPTVYKDATPALAENITADIDDDRRPQDLTDDDLFADIPIEDNLPEWLDCPLASTTTNALHEDRTIIPLNQPSASDLPASQSSCILTHISGNAGKAKPTKPISFDGSENEYPDSDLDASFMDLTTSEGAQVATPQTSPQRALTPKLQWLPPKLFTPANSPRVSHLPVVPHQVPPNINKSPTPFLRPIFPKPILDRSPIIGLTNRTVLRTCFRIGEALNAASVASRTNTDAVIELYVRALASSRDGYTQYFQFADLFTDKPPYLNGLYGMWKGVGLWEQDSRVFLGEEGKGKMCRVLGRVKRSQSGRGFTISILSVWECAWADVEVAKGIVCSY
ncbi:MAG: hypothetical protein Q9217_001049 [Psora testacea]